LLEAGLKRKRTTRSHSLSVNKKNKKKKKWEGKRKPRCGFSSNLFGEDKTQERGEKKRPEKGGNEQQFQKFKPERSKGLNG